MSPKEKIIQAIEDRFLQVKDLVINEGHVLLGGEEKTVHDFVQYARQKLDQMKFLVQNEVSFVLIS